MVAAVEGVFIGSKEREDVWEIQLEGVEREYRCSCVPWRWKECRETKKEGVGMGKLPRRGKREGEMMEETVAGRSWDPRKGMGM